MPQIKVLIFDTLEMTNALVNIKLLLEQKNIPLSQAAYYLFFFLYN
jgi:hypothetical protein